MAANRAKDDKHFPIIAHDNPLRRLFSSPRKYCPYVNQDQIVADLGCGPGYYAFALATIVGAKGRVYAVDSDKKTIRTVERKAAKGSMSYMDKAEWEEILEGFKVEQRNSESFFKDRWALVSKKHQ